MASFNGWTIVAMPSSPPPKSLEVTRQNIVGASNNPFSGQQQIQDWEAYYHVLSVTMPPMSSTDAAAWVTFFESLNGMANVFQLTNSTFNGLIPNQINTYWRLNSNAAKFSINDGVTYGFQFEIREAI